MLDNSILNVIKMTGFTFIISLCIMPLMKKIAHHIGAVDVPRTDEENRHIHKKPIPKLGGLGIFISFLIGYMIFGVHSVKMNAILMAAFIIIITGLIDDVHDLKSKYKLIGQVVSALILTCYGSLLIENITVFGLPTIEFGLLAYPITIFFIVACVNIINLIDGLDGLSGGISSIFYLTTGIICVFQLRTGSLEMILSFIMLGSTLGFLAHNFYPAKIFAGDCSMFMGFMIAVVSLLGFKGMAFSTIFIPLSIIAIPILDTAFAIIRRLLKGKAPFQADKQHLHHQLLGMNFSQRTTVLIIYAIDILFALTSICYVLKDPLIARAIYVVLFILIIWFVCYTNIITEKRPPKLKEIAEKLKKNKKA